jgi:hypothetical protein
MRCQQLVELLPGRGRARLRGDTHGRRHDFGAEDDGEAVLLQETEGLVEAKAPQDALVGRREGRQA